MVSSSSSSSSSFFSFSFFFVLLLLHSCTAHNLPKFSAILIFGDSTVDTGNNNFIPTIFRANHAPYGREFPGHVATGRFSDGKLVPDLVASALGIKDLVPPFLDPHLSNEELKTGANFASAGSGYDDLTSVVSNVIPVSRQLLLFEEYLLRLNLIVGPIEAKQIINDALVTISAGSNDFLFSFYDIPSRKLEYDVYGYQDFLQGKLQDFIKKLISLGCRKFLVAGVPPFGCLPFQITEQSLNLTESSRGCLEKENRDARVYNFKLVRLLKKIQDSNPGVKVVYLNIYDPFIDMIDHPQKYGFVETKKGCCGSGLLEAGPICNAFTKPCANASQYLFWDSIHPGEEAYRVISQFVMENALPSFLS
ncbi:GDSL esterase/lipase At2g30310-like [Macadamia integrifolia]|uniref:GDSL esterase/lipase At2g30310-like n=1 Tax=Macadamia integrifolia TaxID=60698 RepID=UPI001C4EC95B|nr:GDSL esterase/lipase At2g30310-like [Macadamia integrifolia]